MSINPGTDDEQQIPLYGPGQYISNEKYVLARDFSAVTVTSMAISDEADYQCSIEDYNRVPTVEGTALTVYGECRHFVLTLYLYMYVQDLISYCQNKFRYFRVIIVFFLFGGFHLTKTAHSKNRDALALYNHLRQLLDANHPSYNDQLSSLRQSTVCSTKSC